MQTNRYKFFRWTPRTANITVMYLVVVPAILGVIAYKTDVSHLPRPPESAATGYRAVLLTTCCARAGQVGSQGKEEGRRHPGVLEPKRPQRVHTASKTRRLENNELSTASRLFQRVYHIDPSPRLEGGYCYLGVRGFKGVPDKDGMQEASQYKLRD